LYGRLNIKTVARQRRVTKPLLPTEIGSLVCIKY
jgi:hypothetical protein